MAVAASALVAVLAACSDVGAESGATDAAAPGAEYALERPAAEQAPAGSPAMGGEVDAGQDREVITTGSASLVVDDPVAASAQVVALVESAGGRVEARNEWRGSDGDRSSAWLRLRLPAASVTSTIEAFGDVGTVQSVDLHREDVTATGRDLDARIAALTTSTDRLTELMARAENVEDLLGVERELSSRQAELDSLRAQRAALSEQVAMSTLDVRLETRLAAGVGPTGFLGGLAAGWEALVTAGRGTLVVLGALLPWLVVGSGVAVAAVIVTRKVRGRGAPAAPTPAEDAA